MRCKYVRDRAIENWLAGGTEVPPGLRAHLAGCPACGEEVNAARLGYAAIQRLPEAQPPPWLRETVFARIFGSADVPAELSAKPRTPVIPLPLARRPALALAAAVTAILAIAAATTVVSLPRGKTAEYTAAADRVSRSGVLNDIRLLQEAPWVLESGRFSLVLSRVELALEEVANAQEDPSRVGDVARLIRDTNLVESIDRVAAAAPGHDRARVLRISLQLEEIANL